jgi:hypothetical protein
MTATWEAALRAVAAGTRMSSAFLARVGEQLQQLVAEGRALGGIAIPLALPATPPARGRSLRKQHAANAHTPNRPDE